MGNLGPQGAGRKGQCLGWISSRATALSNASFAWAPIATTSKSAAAEARRGADTFLRGAARRHVAVHAYRDGFLPNHWAEVKDAFERIKREFSPDLVFTHYRNDLHQDHRMISELTWNTFRDHLILEYEIPKFDGDLGSPRRPFFP